MAYTSSRVAPASGPRQTRGWVRFGRFAFTPAFDRVKAQQRKRGQDRSRELLDGEVSIARLHEIGQHLTDDGRELEVGTGEPGGLSAFGVKAVERCDRRGIVVDEV